jgi:NTE family protein
MKKEKKDTQQSNEEGQKTKPLPHRPIGLALGSGLARGFAHIGALKALNENQIYPTILAGSSMGALVGGAYLSGRLNDLEDWALSLTKRSVLAHLDFTMNSSGIIGGKKIEKLLRKNFSDDIIEDLDYPFVAIASDLVTGHEVWLRKGDFVDAIMASFALPGVFPPKEINHRYLVDGALVNPVPVSPCQALGSRLTIAIDVNADLIGKSSKPGQKFQTVAGFDLVQDQVNNNILSKSVLRRLFKRAPDSPSLFGVMFSALNIIQDRLTRSRLAGDPPDVHIKPPIGHIGLLEFEKAQEIIDIGYESVVEGMPEIESAIESLLPPTK